MNSISITGRIGNDGEMRYTGTGEAVIGFSVAEDVGYGEKKTTNWWRASLFGKRAESLQQYITKGQQVTIIGSVHLREWTNKDGIKQISPDVRVSDLALVGGKHESRQDAPTRPTQRPAAKPQAGNIDPGDFPF